MFRLNPEAHRNRPIILAVSGGPDSMAMAGHAKDWHDPNADYPLRAVIVDHGIRQGSGDEAVLVKSWLDRMGLSAKIVTIGENAPKAGVQSWARACRYRLLADEARDENAVVVTAHHADDQAETIAMRLAAGSGLAGLSGMKAETQRGDMTILRPFLDTPKDALQQILTAQNIPYVEDPSNLNENFERIAWRARWNSLAVDGMTTERFLKLQSLSSRLYEALVTSIRTAMAGHWGGVPCGALWVDKNAALALPEDAAITMLRSIGQHRGQSRWPVSYQSAKTLLSALKTRHNDGNAMTLAGLEWYCRSDVVWVFPEAERSIPSIPLKTGMILYDDTWQIKASIEGEIMPMGEGRAAQFRRLAPKQADALMTDKMGEKDLHAPMRALWRFPVVMPSSIHASKKHGDLADLSDRDGIFTLEDGAILPHLSNKINMSSNLPDKIAMADCRANYLI